MGFYNKYIMPRIVDHCCKASFVVNERRKIIPLARGVVVEVGIGSGLNLGFYDAIKVKQVIGIDSTKAMTDLAAQRVEQASVEVVIRTASAEIMPLEDNFADTLVMTYSACTIPLVEQALAEMRRVLKPSGSLLFCEHGRSPDAHVARWQDRLNPIWSRIGGGCNLNREIPKLIVDAGFEMQVLETGYLVPRPNFLTYHFCGQAIIR